VFVTLRSGYIYSKELQMNKTVTVQGQTVPFQTYKKGKYIEGGLLEHPIKEIQVKNHILNFSSIYRFTGSRKILGGDLAFVHYLHVGRNWIPAVSALFYENSLDIEYLILPSESKIVVGDERYAFVPDELTFHKENGELMSGTLQEGTTVNTPYGNVLVQKISFNVEGKLVGATPPEDTTLSILGRQYTFKGAGYDGCSQVYHSMHFSPHTGEIVSGMLSSGEKVIFSNNEHL
jgi:hypothetical protein